MAFYIVKLSAEIVVQADSENEAVEEALSCLHDSDGPEFDADVDREIHTLAELPYPWNGRCLPYGGDGEAELKDLLQEKP